MSSNTDFSDFDLEAGKIVELDIDGKIFKYKKASNADELDWAPDYMDIIESEIDGKIVNKTRQNYGKLNKCKLRNVIDAPYTRDHVKKIMKLDSEFRDLSPKQREDFLCSLNSDMMGKLITKITAVSFTDSGVKKNL